MTERRKLALGGLIAVVLATASGLVARELLRAPPGIPSRFSEWRGHGIVTLQPDDLPATSQNTAESHGFLKWGEVPLIQQLIWSRSDTRQSVAAALADNLGKSGLTLPTPTVAQIGGHANGDRYVLDSRNMRIMIWSCEHTYRTFLLVMRGGPTATAESVDEWEKKVLGATHCH